MFLMLILCDVSNVQLILGLFSVCLCCNAYDVQEVEWKKYWKKSRLYQFFSVGSFCFSFSFRLLKVSIWLRKHLDNSITSGQNQNKTKTLKFRPRRNSEFLYKYIINTATVQEKIKLVFQDIKLKKQGSVGF